jgi:DNA-directed RNA polymerase subunit RPC12/RpoP
MDENQVRVILGKPHEIDAPVPVGLTWRCDSCDRMFLYREPATPTRCKNCNGHAFTKLR